MGNGWLKTHSAGAGPYKLTSWAASDHVIIDANPHSGIKVGAKRVVIRHVKDPAAQLLLLQKGDADIARDLQADQLKTIKGNPAYHLVDGQAGHVDVHRDEPVDAAARQAARSIRRSSGRSTTTRSRPTSPPVPGPSISPSCPRGCPARSPSSRSRRTRRRRSSCWRRRGCPNGFAVTMDYISASPYSEIAQAVQQDLGEIGIKVTLLPGEQKQVITKTRARTHQLAMLVWGTGLFRSRTRTRRPSAPTLTTATAARSRFSPGAATSPTSSSPRQAAAAAKELDAKKRIALYQEMQRQFWQRSPFAMLLQKNDVAVLRKAVTGLKLGRCPTTPNMRRSRRPDARTIVLPSGPAGSLSCRAVQARGQPAPPRRDRPDDDQPRPAGRRRRRPCARCHAGPAATPPDVVVMAMQIDDIDQPRSGASPTSSADNEF